MHPSQAAAMQAYAAQGGQRGRGVKAEPSHAVLPQRQLTQQELALLQQQQQQYGNIAAQLQPMGFPGQAQQHQAHAYAAAQPSSSQQHMNALQHLQVQVRALRAPLLEVAPEPYLMQRVLRCLGLAPTPVDPATAAAGVAMIGEDGMTDAEASSPRNRLQVLSELTQLERREVAPLSVFAQCFTEQAAEVAITAADARVRAAALELLSLSAFRHPEHRYLLWSLASRALFRVLDYTNEQALRLAAAAAAAAASSSSSSSSSSSVPFSSSSSSSSSSSAAAAAPSSAPSAAATAAAQADNNAMQLLVARALAGLLRDCPEAGYDLCQDKEGFYKVTALVSNESPAVVALGFTALAGVAQAWSPAYLTRATSRLAALNNGARYVGAGVTAMRVQGQLPSHIASPMALAVSALTPACDSYVHHAALGLLLTALGSHDWTFTDTMREEVHMPQSPSATPRVHEVGPSPLGAAAAQAPPASQQGAATAVGTPSAAAVAGAAAAAAAAAHDRPNTLAVKQEVLWSALIGLRPKAAAAAAAAAASAGEWAGEGSEDALGGAGTGQDAGAGAGAGAGVGSSALFGGQGLCYLLSDPAAPAEVVLRALELLALVLSLNNGTYVSAALGRGVLHLLTRLIDPAITRSTVDVARRSAEQLAVQQAVVNVLAALSLHTEGCAAILSAKVLATDLSTAANATAAGAAAGAGAGAGAARAVQQREVGLARVDSPSLSYNGAALASLFHDHIQRLFLKLPDLGPQSLPRAVAFNDLPAWPHHSEGPAPFLPAATGGLAPGALSAAVALSQVCRQGSLQTGLTYESDVLIGVVMWALNALQTEPDLARALPDAVLPAGSADWSRSRKLTQTMALSALLLLNRACTVEREVVPGGTAQDAAAAAAAAATAEGVQRGQAQAQAQQRSVLRSIPHYQSHLANYALSPLVKWLSAPQSLEVAAIVRTPAARRLSAYVESLPAPVRVLLVRDYVVGDVAPGLPPHAALVTAAIAAICYRNRVALEAVQKDGRHLPVLHNFLMATDRRRSQLKELQERLRAAFEALDKQEREAQRRTEELAEHRRQLSAKLQAAERDANAHLKQGSQEHSEKVEQIRRQAHDLRSKEAANEVQSRSMTVTKTYISNVYASVNDALAEAVRVRNNVLAAIYNLHNEWEASRQEYMAHLNEVAARNKALVASGLAEEPPTMAPPASASPIHSIVSADLARLLTVIKSEQDGASAGAAGGARYEAGHRMSTRRAAMTDR